METPKKPVPPSDDIDISRYLSLFISNWIWFAIAMFLSLALAYLYNHYTPRVYSVKSTILIEEEKNAGSMTNLENLLPSGSYWGNWRNLENEITILESYALNYRVMEEMPELHTAYMQIARHGFKGQRMYKTSPFIMHKTGDKQPTGVKMIIKFTGSETYKLEVNDDDYEAWLKNNGDADAGNTAPRDREFRLGEVYSYYGFNFVVEKRDSLKSKIKDGSRYLVWFESPEDLANQYRSKLSVTRAKKDASVFQLSLSGYSPVQCADYLNKLMELYGTQGLEWKNRAAESTILFIETQLGLISDSLNKAENTMERFRLNNRFVDLTLEGSLVLQKLEKYESEKNAIDLQKQYYDYLLNYIDSREESGSIISPSVMGVTDPALIKLVEDFSVLQQKKKQVSFSLKGDLPLSEMTDRQIEDARAAVRENVTSAINQLKLNTRSVNERIASVEQELNRLPGTERQLIGIQRKFDLNNSIYTFLLERRAEAGIARASQMSDSRIIDMAVPHNSSLMKPNVMKNYLIALMLGLMLPVMVIVLLDLFNNKVIGRHDIEAVTKASILGFISHSEYHDDVPVIARPSSTLAESFRAVRTSLGFYTGQTKCPVIAISSPVSGEGKTFITLNLAAIIAMMNKKVLIIGLDLRKPRAHAILSDKNNSETGMSSYLSYNAEYEDVIVPTGMPNLWFATAGTPPPNPSELIGSPRMDEFIARARDEYDTIIIDTPPVGLVTDAMLLSHLTNVNLFVIRQRYTTKESVHLLDEIYRKGEMTNIALLVNDISTTGYFGYGLRYGYTLGYGHRYYDPGNYMTRNRNKGAGYYMNE